MQEKRPCLRQTRPFCFDQLIAAGIAEVEGEEQYPKLERFLVVPFGGGVSLNLYPIKPVEMIVDADGCCKGYRPLFEYDKKVTFVR